MFVSIGLAATAVVGLAGFWKLAGLFCFLFTEKVCNVFIIVFEFSVICFIVRFFLPV